MKSLVTTKNGQVIDVKGKVSLVTETEQKEVTIGEMIPEGSTILIAEQADLELAFADGTSFTSQSLNETSAAEADALNEIEQLQALIASGEDPTAELPETAAGNTAASEGDSGFISVSRTGAQTLAGAGYTTSGFSVEQPTVQAFTVSSDDAPTITANDTNTIAEDGVATGNVLDNDVDFDTELSVVTFTVDGQTVTAGATVEVEGGSLVINADGSYTFTPNDNWNGSVPVITYTTNTGESATLTINVTPVDDPSILANDSNTIAEDTVATGNVLDNDSDIDSELSVVSFSVDGQTVTAGTTVEVEGGSLVINADGSYTFTPNDNWNGSVPVITYTTNTGESATLTINVTPVDDPSILANDSNTVAEDTVATGNVLDNDSDIDSELSVVSFSVDGQTVTAGTAVEVEGGSLVINADGSYTFTPNDNWNGSVPVITYTTNTGESATLTINVTPVDDTTNAVNDFNTVAEDTIASGNVLDNDSDVDDTLSVVSFEIDGNSYIAGNVATLDGGIFFLNADGSYSFVPNENWNGNVPVVTYITNTGATATLTIVVTPVDDATSAVDDYINVPEDTVASGNVLDNDSDVDDELSVVSFEVNGNSYTAGSSVVLDGGTLVLNADGSYSFTPNADWNGYVPEVTYTTNTGATAILTIYVDPVDDATNAVNDFNTVAEDTIASGNVLDNDSDVDDTLSVVSFEIDGNSYIAGNVATLDGGIFFLNADGSYSFVPNENWNGNVPVVTYITNTGATATLTIVVTPVDDATSAVDDYINVPEDTVASGNVLDNDSDVDDELSVVSFEVNGNSYTAGSSVVLDGGTLVLNADGSYSFTPNADWNGYVPEVTYTTNTGATAILTIYVDPVDDATNAVNDFNTVAEDTIASGNVLDNDSDVDDTLSVVSFEIDGNSYIAGNVATLDGGIFFLNADGSYSFVPNENWNGNVPVVTYITNTGATATLTIVVTPVDDTTNAVNDFNTIAEDTVASGNVLDNDSDIDNELSVATFTVDGEDTVYNAGESVELEGGILVLNADGSYTFTPNDNWNGSVPVVTYTTNTGDSATLTINVTPVNDDFTDDNEVINVNEDSGATTGNVIDGTSVDGELSVQSFSIDGVTGPFTLGQAVNINGVGSFTLNADGSYSFTPAANYNGPVPVITYVLTDGSSTDTSTLTITVDPVNDDFTDDNEAINVNEDSGATTGNVIDGTSVDGELSVQSFSIDGVDGPFTLGQAVNINGVGSFTLNADGSYSFTPAANYNGPVPVITYVLTDGSSTDTSTLTITVDPVNDDFTDDNEAINVNEDSGATTGNVIDGTSVDGELSVQSFSIDGVTGPFTLGQAVNINGVGSFTLNADGSYSFTPAANYNGPVPVITYVLTDGSSTDTSTLTITVDPVNDDFTDDNEVINVNEDSGATTGNVIDGTSVDGELSVQSFSIDGVDGPFTLGQAVNINGVGSFTLNADGSYSFTPAANYNGPVPVITYVLTDGSSTDTSTLTITVDPVNDDFTDDNEVINVNEDSGATTGNVIDGTSVDGELSVQSFSIDGVTGPFTLGQAVNINGVGSFTLNADGSYSFTPAANYNGPVPVITYVLTDGSSTDTSTLTITVDPVNDDFTDDNEVINVNEDSGATTGNVIDGTSVDGELSVQSFSIDGVTGPFTLGQAVNINGVGSFTLNADGSYSFTPAANYNGPVPVITYVLTDGSSTDTSTLTITVDPVNDDFTDDNEVINVNEDSGATTGNVIDGTSVDGELSVQSFSIDGVTGPFTLGQAVNINGVGSFTLNADGSYSFTPAANYNGPVPVITYVLTDGSSTDTSTLTITVDPVNDDFTDNNEVINVNEDSGATTGNVIDGTSVDGELSVQSFSIDGVTGPFTLGQAVNINGVGSFTLNADGSYSFTPAANYNGPVPVITYVLTDGSSTDTSTLTITVDPVNDDFTDDNEVINVNEDSGATTGNVIDGTSVDGELSVQSFSIDGVTGPFTLGQAVNINGVGSFTLNADGSYSFTPAANYNGPVPVITYVLTDGSSTDTSTLTITVDPVNDDFTDDNEVINVNEDSGATTGNVIDDTSVDGELSVQSFSIDGVTGPFTLGQAVNINGVGSFTLNADGSYSFTPAANYNGPVPVITYVLTDGSSTDTSTLTITVDPVNDDFTDDNEVINVNEDSGATTGNVIDGTSVDGELSVQSFSIDGVDGPFTLGQAVNINGVGSFTLNADGSYSFTPAANYNGPVPVITYVLTDGSSTDTSTLTITVDPVNDDFTDDNEVINVNEDSGATTGNVIDGTSVDGELSVQSFSIDGVTGPFTLGQAVNINGVGSFTLNADGSYSFTPAANYNGPVPVITYVLTDGSSTDTSTLTITVDPVNDDFTDDNEVINVNEDSGATTGNVIDGTSVDGELSVQSFSIDGVTGPFTLGQAVNINGVGSFTLNADGSYSFTPAANYNGPVPVITYVLTDGSSTDTSTLTITVDPVNDDFTDDNEAINVNEDSGATTGNVIDGTSVDGELSVQSFSIDGVTGPFTLGQAVNINGVGSFTLNADGSYSFTPAANYNGPVPVITYVLTDGSSTDTSTLTITVDPVNDDFTDDNEVINVNEDSGATTGNVIDGTSVDGELSVQSFSIDGVTGPFTLGQAVNINGVGSFTLNADGSYSFTPAANYNGPVPVITYVLTDGSSTDTSTLTITVDPVNDDFTDDNEVINVNEDSGATTGNVIDGTSVDGELSVQSFSIDGVTGPFTLGQAVNINGVGSFTLNADGSYSFTPAANYNGPVPVITYVLTDGSSTDTSTLTITVDPVNDDFTDNNEVINVNEDSGATTGNVIDGTSVDGELSVQSFSIDGVTGPFTLGQAVNINGVGSFTLNADGSYSFTPAANYNGPVPVITYVLTDGSSTDTSTLTITVDPVNDDFTDNNEVINVNEDSGATTGNVIDGTSVDGELSVQSFSIDGVTGPFTLGQAVNINGVGSFTLNADGSYSFTPAANYNGPVPVITYVLTDGSSTDTSTLTITVDPVNDDFTDDNEVINVNEDSGATTGNVIDDTSVDGELSVQSFSIDGVTGPFTLGQAVNINGVGSFTLNADGSYSFTPAANYNGPVPVITYVLTDGSSTDTSTLTITVTPDNTDVANDAITVAEDTVASGNVLSNDEAGNTSVVSFTLDTDGNGSQESFTAGDSVTLAGGVLVVNSNGSYSFTPNQDWNGSVPVVTYTTNTGETATLTITVTPDNTDVANDAITVAEDTVASGNVLSNDEAGNTSVVSFTLDTDGNGSQESFIAGDSVTLAGGVLVVNSNGSYSFTPNQDWNGSVPVVTYTTNTGETATLTITVTPDNTDVANDAITVAEDTVASGNVLSNDEAGNTSVVSFTLDTDGNGSQESFIAGDSVTLAGGVLVVNSNGSYSFTPNQDWNGSVPVVTYTTNTGETATLTITVTPGVDGGNNVDLIVDDANTQGTATDSDSAGLSFTAGAYDVTGFAFGNIGDINVSGLDANISWSLDSSGNLIGKIDGNAVLQLSLSGSNISAGATGTVTVSVTLLDNLPHGTSVDELVINGITVVATDAANDTATGTVSVKVIDDGVTVNPLDLAGDNAAGIYDGVINVDGADQGFSADLSGNISGAGTFSDSGITAGGLTVFYYVDPANPSMLIAYSDTSGTPSAYDSGNSAQSVIFTLSIDPNGGTYQLDLKHAIDELSTVTVANMSGGKGGNTPAVYVTFDGTNYIIDNDINDVDPNNAMVFSLTSTVGNISSTVNGNTNGFGVANAFVDQGENLIIDYANDVASASVSFDGATYIHFKAYDADGNLLGEGDITNGQTIGNLGEISYIEISTSSLDNHSNFQFTGTSAENIVSSTVDVDLDFVVDVTDSDGDTSTGSIHVDLDAPGSTTTAPTALTSNAVSMLSEADLYKDGTESDSQSLRFKSGSESITAFQFGDTDNIHVSGVNAKISWSFNDEGQLIGTFMGKEAIRLTLNGDRIESGEEGSVSVTAELLASFPHNVSTENLVISGINIVGVDALGQKAVSTITVSVSDYAEAVNDSVRGTEDHDLSGNLLTNDIDPDDELSIVSFKLSGNTYQADGSTINLAEGKLSIHADGRFTFEPNLHWSGTLPQIEYLTNTGDTAILDLNVVAVADAPILSASTGDVVQGEVALDINVALVDRDGSESLTDVTIQGVPSGVSLSAGTLNADGSWTVAVNQLGNLSIKADDSYNGDLEFTLTIKASSVEQSNSDSASSQTTLDVSLRNYHYDNGTDGDNVINGGEDNDVIVSDTTGIQVVQGENYNVAFILDSSGSMGSNRIESAKDQLLQVFNTLKASVGGATSGTVNVLLVDFNSGTKAHVAVNLADSDAISKLESVLNEISSDNGRTNYEAAFETVIDWFSHGSAASNTGTNLTYFITDGETNNYNVDADPEDVWVYYTDNYRSGDDRTLSDLLNDYIPGKELTYRGKVIIDEYGNINYWSGYSRYDMDGRQIGSIRVDENGDYYVAKIASGYSNGNGTDVTAESEALAAFQVLNTLSNVEAIGIGSGISLNKLTPYDSDGNVATNINVSDLASIILGSKEMLLQGDDTVNAGEGNDIVFGDLVQFDGIDGQGYAALQKYVALQLGEDASTVTIQDVHEFVAANPALFDTSRDHDGDDIIAGNQGDDILFGQGGDDELHGGSGDDMLLGGHGSDMLIGGAGEDILIGGLGDDTLTGGTGKADGEADTFVWQQGDTGTDHITDFDINQDKLDLSDLLQGENGGNLEDYLHFTVDNGSTTIEIDANNDGHVDQTIVLDGVDLSHLGTTDGQIINGLLGSEGNGALIVDNANVNQAASSFAVPTTQDDDSQIQHLVP
ncbi:retention module-containing protein [Shewanella loihica]|nr:retention module-containing protein [Shewanella loihica]